MDHGENNVWSTAQHCSHQCGSFSILVRAMCPVQLKDRKISMSDSTMCGVQLKDRKLIHGESNV